MFAVPGWSVSAELLIAQKDISATKLSKSFQTNGPSEPISDADHKSTKPTKKRKRGKANGNLNSVIVTSENLAELWEKHIEGRTLAKDNGVEPATEIPKRNKRRREEGLVGDREQLLGTASLVPTDKTEVEGGLDKRTASKGKNREDVVVQAATKRRPERSADVLRREESEPESSSKAMSTRTENLSASRVPAAKFQPQAASSVYLTPLQQTMREKLVSSRFRYLNQTLYTTPSKSSYELFQNNPSFFTEYHEGFRRQVSSWPENPVDGFVKWIRDRSKVGGNRADLGSQKARFRKKNKEKTGNSDGRTYHVVAPVDTEGIEPLPRNARSGLSTIADLGCGDAQLAQKLSGLGDDAPPGPVFVKSLNLRIHSFDLAAPSPLISVADIRSLPLADSTVDIAIFCLALMGTNWTDFIEEAWRILRWKGECWISEVGSRFVSPTAMRVEHSVGNKIRSDIKNKKEKAKPELSEENAIEDRAMAEEDRVFPLGHAQSSTDVSLFVDVLRTRGFVLAGEPDLDNKMFVRMRFLKALTPTKGKGVPVQNDAGGQTWGKKKFVDRVRDGEIAGEAEREGRVLKPCVYKTR